MELILNVSERLHQQIEEYCIFNNITSLYDYVASLIERGFLTDKYGDLNSLQTPTTINIEYESADYDINNKTLIIKIKGFKEKLIIKIEQLSFLNDVFTTEKKVDIDKLNETTQQETHIIQESNKINKTRRKLTSK